MISIILMEPETPGNIGAVARAMKNFGLARLILINPQCNHLDNEAVYRSTHAKNILKKAKIEKKSILKTFDTLIGTTSINGSEYNIARVPLTPENLSKRINKNQNIAILFGRESSGLRNNEIKQCDFVVTINSSKRYSTLNISHAAAIILYELFKKRNKTYVVPATKTDKTVLANYIDKSLENLPFSTKDKVTTQKVIWKKILGKAMLTKREAFGLMGYFRKVISNIKK